MKENNADIYDWLATAGHNFGNTTKVSLALDLVDEELSELNQAILDDDELEILDAINDLYWVIGNVSYFKGITPEKIANYGELVSVSNWSKFCKTEEEAIATVKAYALGTHPDKIGEIIEAYHEEVNNLYVVKRHDGKVLKSINYKNVKTLLEN